MADALGEGIDGIVDAAAFLPGGEMALEVAVAHVMVRQIVVIARHRQARRHPRNADA